MGGLRTGRKLSRLNGAGGRTDDHHLNNDRAEEADLTRLERIRGILDKALNPVTLDVHDESHLHAGHSGAREGGETHYRVEIVSAEFADKSRVDRERVIHSLLAEEFSDGLHALSIKARPPAEQP
jgi:BolA protein